MGLNIYNDSEEKFSETLKALKEMPKVNAPDDFEFNLMIKITNGQFDSEAEEKRQSKWLWILTPAALVVTSVILFITLSQSDIDQKLNPLQNQGSIFTGKTGDSASKEKTSQNSPEKQSSKRELRSNPQSQAPNQQYSNNQAIPQFPQYTYNPFAIDRSFKLDNLLKGRRGNNMDQNQTVESLGPEWGNLFPEELLVNERNSQKRLNDKKAVKDSLKRVDLKNNSLKMKKNIK